MPVVRKTKAKDKARLERARSVWRLLRDAGPVGLGVMEMVSSTDFSVAEVLETLQDIRDKGVDVWAMSDTTGVRFALTPMSAQPAPVARTHHEG